MARFRSRVTIVGAGPAGTTLARILLNRGFAVSIVQKKLPESRVVAIPFSTIRLAAQLWHISPNELIEGPVIPRRRVAWTSRDAILIDDPVVVCDIARWSGELLERLRCCGVELTDKNNDGDSDPVNWLVIASGRKNIDDWVVAGHRMAIAAVVEMIPGFDAHSTVIATTSKGWLFAAPGFDKTLAVCFVQPGTEPMPDRYALTAALTEIFPQSTNFEIESCSLPAVVAPALNCVPIEGRKVYIGDAALAIDPLRGDGVGFALRGALLAQAAIAAAMDCTLSPSIAIHYSGRLREVFYSHIANCIRHYAHAQNARLWRREIVAMRSAIERIPSPPDKHEFRLVGMDLFRSDYH
jgi:flavin-dependent dehydrogenase